MGSLQVTDVDYCKVTDLPKEKAALRRLLHQLEAFLVSLREEHRQLKECHPNQNVRLHQVEASLGKVKARRRQVEASLADLNARRRQKAIFAALQEAVRAAFQPAPVAEPPSRLSRSLLNLVPTVPQEQHGTLHSSLRGLSCVLNTMTGGDPRETFSCRTGRASARGYFVSQVLEFLIDWIFFWEDRHCYHSWMSSLQRNNAYGWAALAFA